MKIWSSKFKQGQRIPNIYTCMGKDISPPLLWEDVPNNVESFVLIVDDPDAPSGTWVHWVVYNIPKYLRSLKEGIPNVAKPLEEMAQGKNDFGKIGYGGPCPPPGSPHKYFFKLYALYSSFNLPDGLTKLELLKKVKDAIIDEVKFYGIFSR